MKYKSGVDTIMFFIAFFVLFLAYHSSANTLQPEECTVAANVSSHLNLAIEIIKNVRDSDCVCGTLPSDCEDVLRRGQTSSGVYKIMPRSRVLQNPIEVYCDMTTDKGGWTVIQRRQNFNHTLDYFFKDWLSYKIGFGKTDKDFWLGNDNIFALSNQKLYSVRFDLKDVDGEQRYAIYDTFWIDDEDHKYKLHIDGYTGDAGDSMTDKEKGFTHNGMIFSTKDKFSVKDRSGQSCAARYKGAWWYNMCHRANLNGQYHKGEHESFADGIIWYAWKGYNYSLEWVEMKIRSKDFRR